MKFGSTKHLLPPIPPPKTQKSLENQKINKAYCDRDRIRTCDRLLRRQMLYPAELRDHYVGVAGFEPATSCSQSRRDDRATLHPDWCHLQLFAERPGFEPGHPEG